MNTIFIHSELKNKLKNIAKEKKTSINNIIKKGLIENEIDIMTKNLNFSFIDKLKCKINKYNGEEIILYFIIKKYRK